MNEDAIFMTKKGGRWWVWMAKFTSAHIAKPPRFGAYVQDFSDERSALAYARRLIREEEIPYGLQILEDK